jgi:hypothetical protein
LPPPGQQQAATDHPGQQDTGYLPVAERSAGQRGRVRICTYVSHQSKDRDLGVPYWEPPPLADALVEEADRFADAAEAEATPFPKFALRSTAGSRPAPDAEFASMANCSPGAS